MTSYRSQAKEPATPNYFNRYENLAMERTDSGILTVRFHTAGGPIVFTGQTHHDLPRALAEVGDDRENKIVILTGSGDVFMDEIDGDRSVRSSSRASGTRPTGKAGACSNACSRSRHR